MGGLSSEVGGVGVESAVVAVFSAGAAGAVVVGVGGRVGFHVGGFSGGVILALFRVLE